MAVDEYGSTAMPPSSSQANPPSRAHMDAMASRHVPPSATVTSCTCWNAPTATETPVAAWMAAAMAEGAYSPADRPCGACMSPMRPTARTS